MEDIDLGGDYGGDGLDGFDGFGIDADLVPGLDDALPEMEMPHVPEPPPRPSAREEGLVQTTYGAHPWGTGAGAGYQPHGMTLTDRSPLGGAKMDEELAQTTAAAEEHPPDRDVTRYDRTSFERGRTVGTGIFDQPEEGPRSRSGSGIFDTDFAQPDYMAREPDVGIWESEVIDLNTGLPRVYQGNATGVQFAADAPGRAYSPYAPPPYGTETPVRSQPGVQRPVDAWFGDGGMGAIEDFGRTAADALLAVAAQIRPADRSAFLSRALDALGPGKAHLAEVTVSRLVSMGYPAQDAVRQVVSHLLMHATAADVLEKVQRGDSAPNMRRLDGFMGGSGLGQIPQISPVIAAAAQRSLLPMLQMPSAAAAELQRYATSPAAQTESAATPAPSGGGGMPTWLKWTLGLSAAAGAGYLGYRWWKGRQK